VGKLEDMGFQLLAVSTDTVAMLQEYEESADLDYLLLSDPELNVATKLGIKFKVVQAYIDHVAEIHVDLDEQNGGYLVTPAAFVFDTTGTIRFVYANNNYTVRVSEEALLDAAQAALE
jgi:peroxiredoxin